MHTPEYNYKATQKRCG